MKEPSLYGRLRQALSEFLFVLFHWREYHDAVLTIHQPWFDIVEGAIPQYMGDPANWRCKFCGRKYKHKYLPREPWEEIVNLHSPGCLWPRIEKIHPYYR